MKARAKRREWLVRLALSAAFVQVASGVQAGTCRVDRAHYAALRVGTSYDRVRHMLGCPGRTVGRIVVGRIRRTTYSWGAKGTYGATVTLTFRNGRLTDKTQLGLR